MAVVLACDLSQRDRLRLQSKFDANRTEYARLRERLDNPNLPQETRARLQHRYERLAEEILPQQFAQLLQGVNPEALARKLKEKES